MSITLTSKDSANYTMHPEGVHPGVCVDVIDLGMVETEFQGVRSMKHKIQLVWETEEKGDDGKRLTLRKSFTASLHPKAVLAKYLGNWRGKPVAVGETVDFDKLIGAACTLVVAHKPKSDGSGEYVAIEAISKPTKKLQRSGEYNPAETRERINKWRAENGQPPLPTEAKPEPEQPAEADDVGF